MAASAFAAIGTASATLSQAAIVRGVRAATKQAARDCFIGNLSTGTALTVQTIAAVGPYGPIYARRIVPADYLFSCVWQSAIFQLVERATNCLASQNELADTVKDAATEDET